MPWDRFLIQVSFKYTWVPPVASPRLIPLSASSYKLTARVPLKSMLLCILPPRNPTRTAKESACLSHSCFYNHILLWENLWRNKWMTCPPHPRAWWASFVVERRGRTASSCPVPPCVKTHYGYEAVSLYCFAGWRGINAAEFGRTKKISAVLWSMVIDLTLISKTTKNFF